MHARMQEECWLEIQTFCFVLLHDFSPCGKSYLLPDLDQMTNQATKPHQSLQASPTQSRDGDDCQLVSESHMAPHCHSLTRKETRHLQQGLRFLLSPSINQIISSSVNHLSINQCCFWQAF